MKITTKVNYKKVLLKNTETVANALVIKLFKQKQTYDLANPFLQ